MRTIALAALAAIEAGEAIVGGAVDIVPPADATATGAFDGGAFDGGAFDTGDVAPSLHFWGGYGVLNVGGNAYLPLGDRAFAQQNSGAIGGIAQGMTLGVSGVEAEALALLDPAEVKGATIVVYRLIFAVDGKTLLDFHVWDRGRGDAIASDETIGGPAAVALAVESTARGLGRSGARMRADYDQRLIGPTDGYFKSTAYAAEKSLYWGGQKPSRTGAAVNGSGSGMGGASSPPLGNFSS